MTKLYSSFLIAILLTIFFLVKAPVLLAIPTQENPREWFVEFCGVQGQDSITTCYCYADFLESNLLESEFRALASELKNYFPLDQGKNLENLQNAYESRSLVDTRVSEVLEMAFDQEKCLALEPGGRDYLTRLALHNLYLSCKAFWADHGSKAQCALKEPMDDEYGHYPSDNIMLSISGNEYNFRATAKHRLSDHVYEITADGEIREVAARKK